MLYAAVRLLLKEVIKVFVLGVAVIAHGVLVDVVQQVEVEVLYAALLSCSSKIVSGSSFFTPLTI